MQRFSDDRRKSSLIITLARVGALILAVLTALSACKGEPKVVEDAVRPVKVAVVGQAQAQRQLTYSGVVRPRIESAVGFRVAGKIVERLVNVGDRVEVGAVIARLDDTDLRLAASSARAAIASAQTRRDVASDNFERARVLLPKGFIAKAVFDARKNEMDAAVAALETAEAQLRQAINAVRYTTLAADKAGIVTAVMAEPGQVVNAGTPVVALAEAGETEIAIAVPEQDVGRLAVGQPIEVTLWAGPQSALEGRIREISAQADPASRTYAVRATVRNPPPAMRLGMTASVAINVQDPAESVVVPLTALTEIDGNAVVFIVEPASRAVRKTQVTVGGTAPDGMRIADGLQAGDIVVTAGVQFLRDGMRVRLPAEVEQRAAAPNGAH